ncbi:MAG: Lrp/AsnC family transcriptional regulator [Candidatus Nitrosopelagicus sp.]|jgi:DNA-binding Lrp family transcriptional regulator|tara:strand:- start:2671 stop:2910 length:240 start_codon:yes stop_codon:yes gene_type:complete
MNVAYVLVQCKIGYEMKILKELLSFHFVKEAKGTFGFYDILVKIEDQSEKKIEHNITKDIRQINNVITTTTLSVIPEQD